MKRIWNRIWNRIKEFFKVMLICLLIFAGIWCLVHRRVICAWIKHEPMPEMPELHKKCIKWFLGKVAAEGAYYGIERALNSRNRSD